MAFLFEVGVGGGGGGGAGRAMLSLRLRLFVKHTPAAMSEEKRLFSQAIRGLATKHINSKQALWGALVVGGTKERLQLCL